MAAEALEQSVLEAKDKDQLLAIAKALGLKASARTKKSDIIGQILETTGGVSRPVNGDAPAAPTNGDAIVAVNGNGTNGDTTVTSDAPAEVVEITEVELPLDAVVATDARDVERRRADPR